MAKTVTKTTQNKGRNGNLKPWPKGVSGNPGGRPKKSKDIEATALNQADKAIEKLVQLIDSDDDRVALSAAQAILDRAVGKATERVKADVNQTTHVTGEGAVPAVHAFLERFAAKAGERDSEGPIPN